MKLNKKLQEMLESEDTYDYERAKKAWEDVCLYAAVHGLTTEIDGANKVNEAIDKLPRAGEIEVSIRVSKEQIRKNKQLAKFISNLFDLEG